MMYSEYFISIDFFLHSNGTQQCDECTICEVVIKNINLDVKKKKVMLYILLSELDQLQEKYTNLEKELQKSTKVRLKKSRKLFKKLLFLMV